MKTCRKCEELKFNDEFYTRKDRPCGFKSVCKLCDRAISERWKDKNPERTRELSRNSAEAFFRKNPERVRQTARDAYAKDPAARIAYQTGYIKRRLLVDPGFKLASYYRRRVSKALKVNTKCCHTLGLLGCSIPDLKEHLERGFKPGMSWENYGEWHVDHIKPCARFDLSDHTQQRACFHFSNLQPLWGIDNLKKSDAYPY